MSASTTGEGPEEPAEPGRDAGTPGPGIPDPDASEPGDREVPVGESPTGDTDPEAASPPATLLPERVRHRVVATAGDTFAGLTLNELPLPLRQYARFTPTRRVRLGAAAIAAVVEEDTVFRHRVASRWRAEHPELTAALEAGVVPPAADPVEVATTAYLVRPSGWAELVETAGREERRRVAERADEQRDRELARLRAEAEHARSAGREETERLRTELEEARREGDALHRKVRSARSDVRRGEAELRKLRAVMDAERAELRAERSRLESEVRRLRARLAETETALESSRRAAREGRSLEDMRVRLLLDTVVEAARGLSRELALPPVEVLPAETVEAISPETAGPGDIPSRAMEENDPALLDQLLALPRAHLVVDGYNVTKTGYPHLPLEKQRQRLLSGLAVLAARSGAETTCVFDGAELAAPVMPASPRGVRVLFSPPEQTADELIRRLVRAEPPGRPVVVVSTDREVADGVARAGARPVASAMLLRRLNRT
ncbi:RNA-binding protein [Streptomyces alkaliphilus]|uniref:RNA-binding protein n=1 Tax=Streptomyces alkaliphilus TaxID=1472722 RepID=A0A7W3Y119_9ACTN|nr:RNA-binding protein [Streptomyces alkaliphilus]